MRNLFTFLILIVLIAVSSCRKDFTTIPNFGNLEFSKDTVFLDTIFTNIGSSTYTLKVYNRNSKTITIPSIQLENGVTSNYRLNVDGIPGKSFADIDILARDSIFIFIETTVDVNTISNPLYTDRILFDNGEKQQDVDLVTLVQDAHFIYPGKDPITMKIDSLSLDGDPTTIKGRFLTDAELQFTNQKPYVIYGYAAIPANKKLQIDAGTKVYFHDNSGLIVDTNGTLEVNGTVNEKVVFEGDRLENSFSRIPGQWGTIWLRKGSKENRIEHAQIKNGLIGILVDSLGTNNKPTLELKNTEIYNHSNFGILAREAHIEGENIVIGSAGQASFAGTVGGNYGFIHSTFANYWNNGIRQLPTVLVNNFFTFIDSNNQEVIATRDLIRADFTNCIISGNNNIEFVLDKVDGALFNYSITNSMIQFEDVTNAFENNTELDFTNSNYQNIILNGNPNFRDTVLQDFIIGQNSDAINKATASSVVLDLLGVDRSSAPDIGAYQHILFN